MSSDTFLEGLSQFVSNQHATTAKQSQNKRKEPPSSHLNKRNLAYAKRQKEIKLKDYLGTLAKEGQEPEAVLRECLETKDGKTTFPGISEALQSSSDATQLETNVADLFKKLPQGHSAFRQALAAMLLTGLPLKYAQQRLQVSKTMWKKAHNAKAKEKCSSSPLWYDHGHHRKGHYRIKEYLGRVSEAEVEATLRVLKEGHFLKPHSGSNQETYYIAAKTKFYAQQYVGPGDPEHGLPGYAFRKILVQMLAEDSTLATPADASKPTRMEKNFMNVAKWINEGRNEGEQPILTPRAYETLLNEIMRKRGKLQLRIDRGPHPCSICDSHASNLEKVKELSDELERGLNLDARKIKSIQKELKQLQKAGNKHSAHLKQLETQRAFTQELEQNLQPGECVIYRDFVSAYLTNGKKLSNLSFAIVTKDADEELPKVEYVDTFFQGKSDARAVYNNFRFLLQQQQLQNIHKIYLSGDNGSHFSCYETMYFLSTIFKEFGIEVQNHTFPANHGFNRCDSHGGHWKSAIFCHQIAMDASFKDADEVAQWVNVNLSCTAFAPPQELPSQPVLRPRNPQQNQQKLPVFSRDGKTSVKDILLTKDCCCVYFHHPDEVVNNNRALDRQHTGVDAAPTGLAWGTRNSDIGPGTQWSLWDLRPDRPAQCTYCSQTQLRPVDMVGVHHDPSCKHYGKSEDELKTKVRTGKRSTNSSAPVVVREQKAAKARASHRAKPGGSLACASINSSTTIRETRARQAASVSKSSSSSSSSCSSSSSSSGSASSASSSSSSNSHSRGKKARQAEEAESSDADSSEPDPPDSSRRKTGANRRRELGSSFDHDSASDASHDDAESEVAERSELSDGLNSIKPGQFMAFNTAGVRGWDIGKVTEVLLQQSKVRVALYGTKSADLVKGSYAPAHYEEQTSGKHGKGVWDISPQYEGDSSKVHWDDVWLFDFVLVPHSTKPGWFCIPAEQQQEIITHATHADDNLKLKL